MTAISPTFTPVSGGKLIISWPGLVPGDVGDPVEISDFDHRSVMWTGTLSGSDPIMQGSNDVAGPWTNIGVGTPSGWINISKDVVSIEPRYIRPAVVNGSTVGLSFTLFCTD